MRLYTLFKLHNFGVISLDLASIYIRHITRRFNFIDIWYGYFLRVEK